MVLQKETETGRRSTAPTLARKELGSTSSVRAARHNEPVSKEDR
jgi:hypothetical protein